MAERTPWGDDPIPDTTPTAEYTGPVTLVGDFPPPADPEIAYVYVQSAAEGRRQGLSADAREAMRRVRESCPGPPEMTRRGKVKR